VTEVGWEMEGTKVEFFKDYDFAFLGDIHKMQFLDYREAEIEIDEDELFKYPGCTVVE